MNATLKLWAEIILKAVIEHPEKYPTIARAFNLRNLTAINVPIEAKKTGINHE